MEPVLLLGNKEVDLLVAQAFQPVLGQTKTCGSN
jgi:hypothetical protein